MTNTDCEVPVRHLTMKRLINQEFVPVPSGEVYISDVETEDP